MCKVEKLDATKLNTVIGDYLFTERKPLPDDIINMLEIKPKLLERKNLTERIINKVMKFIDTFINGIENQV